MSPNYDEVIQWLVSFSFLFLDCLIIWCTFPDLSNNIDLFLNPETKIIFVAHFPSIFTVFSFIPGIQAGKGCLVRIYTTIQASKVGLTTTYRYIHTQLVHLAKQIG